MKRQLATGVMSSSKGPFKDYLIRYNKELLKSSKKITRCTKEFRIFPQKKFMHNRYNAQNQKQNLPNNIIIYT